MFLRKLFAKDHRFYQEKGEKYFAEERYSDARHAFEESLKLLQTESGEDDGTETKIRGQLAETGNRLALMNLSEAEFAMNRGDFVKAEEHLQLIAELTHDVSIREKAERLRGGLSPESFVVESEETRHNCAGCITDAATTSGNDLVPDFLSAQERFELLVQTLPGGLQERYAALGEKFARAYVLVHGEDRDAGAGILQELLNEGENDILLYEIALIHHNAGNLSECERLLRRALDLNSENPLCCLSLVQLLTDAGRLEESLPILGHMIDKQLLTEQSLLFLGDVNQGLGNEDAAIESYAKALDYPNAAKAAAERLVPIFERLGRRDDATYLFKRYLKGCC